MTFDRIQMSVSTPTENLERNKKILEIYNKVAFEKGMQLVDIDSYEKSFEAKEKGLDGGAAARGSGLIQTQYNNNPSTLGPVGGVWESAGADVIRDVAGGTVQFFAHYGGTGSNYSALATNASATYAGLTSVTNDQTGTIYNESATILGYVVETFIRKSVMQGFLGDADRIIQMFEQDFLRRDDLHNDELGTDAIVTDTNIAGRPASGATVGNIAQTIKNAKAVLQARGVTNLSVHFSPVGYNQFESERVSQTGQFLQFNVGSSDTATLTKLFNSDGSDKEVGHVANFDGVKVYINNGVRNTYAVTGNNISATTGGAYTAFVMGNARELGIGIGKDNLNETKVFEDLEAWRKGAVVIGRQRQAGAVAKLPEAFTYFAFEA